MIQKSDYNFNLMPHSPDRTGCPLKTNAQAMTAVSPLVTAHVFHNHEEVKQDRYYLFYKMPHRPFHTPLDFVDREHRG